MTATGDRLAQSGSVDILSVEPSGEIRANKLDDAPRSGDVSFSARCESDRYAYDAIRGVSPDQ